MELHVNEIEQFILAWIELSTLQQQMVDYPAALNFLVKNTKFELKLSQI